MGWNVGCYREKWPLRTFRSPPVGAKGNSMLSLARPFARKYRTERALREEIVEINLKLLLICELLIVVWQLIVNFATY